METNSTSERLADLLELGAEELSRRILGVLPADHAAALRGAIAGWLGSLPGHLRGGPGRIHEWMAQLLRWARAEGVELAELAPHARSIREAVLAHCAAELPDVEGPALLVVLQDLHDAHVRELLLLCAQMEREEAAAARRRERAMAESLDGAFALLDGNGGITLANTALGDMLGVSVEGLNGAPFADWCDTETAQALRRLLRQRRASAPRGFTGSLQPVRGRWAPVRITAGPLYDASGLRDGLALSIHNLEARAQTPAEGQYQAFHALADALQISFTVLTPSYDAVDTHMHAEADFGNETPLCCQLLGSAPGDARCGCARTFASGAPFRRVVTRRQAKGPRWYNLVTVPLHRAGGRVLQVFALVDDVTDVKSLESRILAQQGASHATRVAVTVAHQLRNPLGVIVGFAELLEGGLPEEQRQGAIEKISRNALRCREIVQGLLEFGQGAPGERGAIEFCALVREHVQPALTAAQRHRVTWEVPHAAGAVECAPQLLAQVCCSLIENGLHAVEHRGGTVTFRVERAEGVLRAFVEDTGPGVPERLRDRIFEPFFTTRKEEGAVGLGLALSHTVVQEHGGQLWLDPGYASGARFCIELPLAEPLEGAGGPSPAPASAAAPVRKRVLVVDDELDLLEMLETLLTLQGYEVDAAGDGAAGAARLRECAYDAAVLDVQLPGDLSGPRLYEILSEVQPALATHTMFITADTMNYETRRFLAEVQRPFLEKPFLMTDLVAMVTELAPPSSQPKD